MKLKDLYSIILKRKNEMPERSYTAKLIREGQNKILKKIAEETGEVIIAAKDKDKSQIIFEISDFFYHILVLMVYCNISIRDIEKELGLRSK